MSHPAVLIALRRARDLADRNFAQPLTVGFGGCRIRYEEASAIVRIAGGL